MTSSFFDKSKPEKHAATIWTPMYIRLGIATILLSAVEQIITVNMSLYLESMGASPSTIGISSSAFMIASMLTRMAAGPMMDRKGRLFTGLLGLYLTVFPLIGYITIRSIGMILFFRLIEGIGYSFASLSEGTMSADIPDPDKMSEGVGYYGFFYSISTAFGPAAGLAVSSRFGYQKLFALCLLIYVFLIFLTYTLNYEKTRHIVYSKERLNVKKLFSSPWNIFEKTAVPTAVITVFISGAYAIVNSFVAVFAEGRNLSGTGVFFTVIAVATIIGRIFSGKWITGTRVAASLIIGTILMAAGVSGLLFAYTNAVFLISASVFGFGSGFAWPALAVLAVINADIKNRGKANSTYYAGYDLGMAAGTFIAGLAANVFGYTSVWAVSAVMFLIGVFLSILFKGKLLAFAHKEQ